MSEYGQEKPLTEILEDLALYCYISGIRPSIKVLMPKAAIKKFTDAFPYTQRVLPYNEETGYRTSKLHTSFNGIIELFNDEENEVTRKTETV